MPAVRHLLLHLPNTSAHFGAMTAHRLHAPVTPDSGAEPVNEGDNGSLSQVLDLECRCTAEDQLRSHTGDCTTPTTSSLSAHRLTWIALRVLLRALLDMSKRGSEGSRCPDAVVLTTSTSGETCHHRSHSGHRPPGQSRRTRHPVSAFHSITDIAARLGPHTWPPSLLNTERRKPK
jgi:hypothetical protein